jgi:hypothetical protein
VKKISFLREEGVAVSERHAEPGAVNRKIVANCIDPEETRVAIIEDGRLADLFVERMWERQKAGEIYKARVESVLPGIHASFVNLGDGRNAFLYLNDARGLNLQPNQELLVQVTKTARKNKGARVTSRISLPGRYVVLVPHGQESGVSKRITDENENCGERITASSSGQPPRGWTRKVSPTTWRFSSRSGGRSSTTGGSSPPRACSTGTWAFSGEFSGTSSPTPCRRSWLTAGKNTKTSTTACLSSPERTIPK